MDRIERIIDSILKMDYIEECFFNISVQRPEIEENKSKEFQEKLEAFFNQQTPECKEAALSIFISRCSETNNHQLSMLFQALDLMVKNNVLSPRIVCEQILSSEKLDYKNELFFVECFKMIKKLIGGVDYKGVREIMKLCRERVNAFPTSLPTSILPQITAVCDVLEYIFDRKACLLPAYFIITELQKQENAEVHWRVSTLTANFIEEFLNLAQMLSIIGQSHMYPILEPATGYGDATNPWRLDPNLRFTTLKGNLPYDSELTQPQIGLLRYVLQQLYSKEMVCSMLNLQKQRSAVLEEQLVWLVVHAMEKSEQESGNDTKSDPNDSTPNHKEWLWLHLSSQLIYFVLFQCATFPNIVNELHEKLSVTNLRKGRDDLMWALLQYISGSIQRNALSNFLPVLKLYDILYNEKEPLPVPDVKHASSTKKIAATCIYIHLLKKAQLENLAIRPIPVALRKHYEFLQQLSSAPNLTIGDDCIVTLLCNAFSTNQEYFSRPMSTLIDTILQNNKPQTQSNQQALTTVPLSMVILDSLTVHSKMSIIHCVVNNLMKQAESKGTMSNLALNHISPALVETYSRLLVYTEIESLGIKGFLSRLLPTVCKSNAWSILYTLLEMFSYRLFHIQAHYRAQLLLQLHNLTQNSHINQAQLHLCFESTALRLITGLGSSEFQFQLSRFLTEPKNLSSIVSNDNEELNRVLILTMARSMHITGMGDVRLTASSEGTGSSNNSYLMDLLQTIMKNTPHSWAQHTRASFPKALNEFYANHNHPSEDKTMLAKSIEEEYRNFLSMTNENDIISYFSQRPSFLCLIYKLITDSGEITPIAYKVLERVGARLFSAQLRTFCDFLLHEVMRRTEIHKLVDAINDMIWKWNIVTIDRFILCLALRTQEQNQAEMPTVQLFVIQLLLIKNSFFRDRVAKFVENNSPEYWKLSNWHEKHVAFHAEFPEKFGPEEHSTTLPVYFGNVCLRFLPVLDIVIHRYLELTFENTVPLDSILKALGSLYKFHDRPITYLYNTLFYYETKLRDRPFVKRMLVGTIIMSLKDVREKNWALTDQYQAFVKSQVNEDPAANSVPKWVPELSYYMTLVKRLIETIEGKNVFPNVDWRFNEFPNPPTHALYVTAVELLGLPVSPQTVSNQIFDVIIKGLVVISYDHIHTWINAVGLIIATLPESYWSVIYDRLEETIKLPQMFDWTFRQSPFEMFNFTTVKCALLDHKFVMILAIAHSIFHHFNIGQTSKMVSYVREKLVPHVKTECQLLYLHHIVSPFLQRLDAKDVIEITKIYYELLELVDKNKGEDGILEFMDPICDMLYHIKYMFVGDSMKADLEPIIRRLSNPLKSRLRFITRLGVEEIKTEKIEQPAMTKMQNQAMKQNISRI
ncbi:hypothetical protein PVAND_015928 [Polypedilum vanderplanki]|uniref:Mediator of RNA polymerase II transcription subunit 23 n=1 Tax=Polypedilum vanderplanki TaxID=319348 RepID=A0A9J6BDL5_POLVA|nr:hypothetical protein PVAND_015928 [Polypedilum vanderplanki]